MMSPAPAATVAQRRTEMLLHAPVLPTLLRLAAPNMVMMAAQAAANFLESYYVGLLGVDELAGVALVFPLIMLMQMLSAGAIGGGISSAISRAMGAGRHGDAESLALHAVVICALGGGLSTAVLLLGGAWLYTTMGGHHAALAAALAYSNVVFAGAVFLWLLNGLASILRGTGNMALPAGVATAGVPILVLVSPTLIFGLGPVPALGIAGAALSLVVYYVVGCAVLLAALLRGRGGLRLSMRHRLRRAGFAEILGVGGPAAINSSMTNVCVGLATSLVGTLGVHTLAGFGLGIRLEYVLIPLVFGFGAGMIPMIGMNLGAGNVQRARQAAWVGAFVAAGLTETLGLAAAIFSHAWLGLFTPDAEAIAAGAAYLHVVAPTYGLIGLGLALQFASQGSRRMRWSVAGGIGRALVISVGGGLALWLVGPSILATSLVVIVSLVVYAAFNAVPWLSPTLGRPAPEGSAAQAAPAPRLSGA